MEVHKVVDLSTKFQQQDSQEKDKTPTQQGIRIGLIHYSVFRIRPH